MWDIGLVGAIVGSEVEGGEGACGVSLAPGVLMYTTERRSLGLRVMEEI